MNYNCAEEPRGLYWLLHLLWFLAVAGAAGTNNHLSQREYEAETLAEARATCRRDLDLGLLVARAGGLYAQTSETISPNPALGHVPHRDITRPDGVRLTLLNPAYLLRLLNENPNQSARTGPRVISLQPLRAANGPDDWERSALARLEDGAPEVAEFVRRDAEPFLRYLYPLAMESHCLKCHAGRGARVGALSILLPVGEKIAAHRRTMWALGPLYLLIYLLGTGFLGLGRRLLLKRAAARALAVEALEESERNFRTVADFAYAWEYWLAPDGSMKYVSPAAEKLTGYPPGRFMADPDLLRNIVLGSDPELLHHHLQGDMRRGEHEIDFQIRTAGGELRWLRHSCRPIYGSRGEFLGRRASNHDITEELAAKKALEQTVGELKSALDKVKLLSGFLPICASCKKIRDDRGYWNQIESYITEHSNAVFSHGICPDCKKRLYPEFCDEEDR